MGVMGKKCPPPPRYFFSGIALMVLKKNRVDSVSHSLKKGQGSGQKKGTFDA